MISIKGSKLNVEADEILRVKLTKEGVLYHKVEYYWLDVNQNEYQNALRFCQQWFVIVGLLHTAQYRTLSEYDYRREHYMKE